MTGVEAQGGAAMASRVVTWILAALFPSSEHLPGIGDLPDAGERVRLMLDEAPLSFALIVYSSALLFVLAPLISIGWPVPAFLLPRAQLDRHAYKMATHRLYLVRQATLMLKTVGGMVWGGHPQVRAALGQPVYRDDKGTFRAGGEPWQQLRDAGQPQG